jgi:hypothetical protein
MRKNSGSPEQDGKAVPKAMQVQLARLFGAESKEASTFNRKATDWRKTLRAVLREIDRYVAENVDTDELHRWMLLSGLAAAEESLKEEDFWPGYAEGITRLALVLLGDYPDHRRLKPGRKKDGHYSLKACRSAQWVQTPEQRFRAVFAASSIGCPKLCANPRDVLDDFRRQVGFGPNHADFMEWYRANFPRDYAALFR